MNRCTNEIPPDGAVRGLGRTNIERAGCDLNPSTNGRLHEDRKPIDACGADAWTAVRLIRGCDEPNDLEACSDAFRPTAERMARLPVEGKERETVLWEWVESQGDHFAEAFQAAMGRIDPQGPPPPIEAEADAGEDWPPLRLKEAPKAESFPVDVFPPILAAFCREVAESTRSAIDVPALGMLTVAGAAIGQSVQIRLKRSWVEPALLYAVVIASPGRAKTPALRLVVRPLTIIDKRLRDGSAVRLAEWEKAKRAHEKDDSAPSPGDQPPQLKAIVKDITRESLEGVIGDNPRGVLCFLDEALAWTNSWNQYKAKGTDEQFWLSIYSGDPLSVDRKSGRKSIHAMHPFAAFLGGIQPKLVRKLRGDDGSENGFLHRIAFALPDVFPKRTWTDTEVSEEAERDWAEPIERLHGVEMRPTEDGPRPWTAELRPEAKARFKEWVNINGAAMDEADDEDREGAMAKAEGRLARLALILSRLRLACDPTRPLLDAGRVPPVELQDVEGAIRLTDYFANHAERVASATTEGAGTADALALLKWIERRGLTEFREANASDDLRRFAREPAALADALLTLTKAGAIRPKPEPAIPGKRGRKPSPLYETHPDLL